MPPGSSGASPPLAMATRRPLSQQLAAFLEAVLAEGDEDSALREGLASAAAAVGAEAGAALQAGRSVALLGYEPAAEPLEQLVAVADERAGAAPLPSGTPGAAVAVRIGGSTTGSLVLVRREGAFTEDERWRLVGFGRLLGLTLQVLHGVSALEERIGLLERLTRIQRSISSQAPLQEVLDHITRGASELLGDPIAGLRLIDPKDPRFVVLASVFGVREELLPQLRRGPIGEGAGGRAIAEERLVVIERYERDERALPVFVGDHLQTAMAAPVRERGRVIGSLTVASYAPGRRYSGIEQAALTALAEHASLALTDAETLSALREAEQSRDLFLAMVSHELKTPLTVIMATLRTLEGRGDSVDPQRRTAMLHVAYERGRDLERLINSLLQSARAELSTTPRLVALRGLVDEALEGFEHTRPITVAEPPDLTLLADPGAVRAILGSLLENATAHSPADSPVAVRCARDGDAITIAVTNTGGLPEDLMPEELFRAFQRGDQVRSSGVGLGLYIASRLARSMGGDVTVHSGQGTVTFTLRLPYSPPDAAVARPTT